jgi:hypothetical protein
MSMGATAAFRERKEVRSFHKLRRSSSGRVLNLINLTDAVVQAAPMAGDKPKSTIKPLFYNNILNYTILTKHNLRDNERDLFARSVHVATKIFIPFDPRRLEIGGRSFFIEEYQFKDHLRELLHLDLATGDKQVLHDIKVLEALSRSPTLDAFVVTECLRADGLRVEPAFFAENYGLATKASADVFDVFKPLVQKALGKTASPEEMSRFVDQVWNVTANTTDNLFLEALQIPRSEWADVIFAWKALIYYDIVSRGTADRLDRVLKVLQGTTPKVRLSSADLAHIEELKRELARNLYKLHDGSTVYIQKALQRLVSAIISKSDANEITDSLRNMARNISSVGMNVVLFDQVTSYFLYLYPKPTANYVDPEDLECELSNLCEIVALRDGELR